ncbi:unnamed protein product [Cochlearia groenlandica]
MDHEPSDIFEEDSSVEQFDIDFEFDAPRFYDFSKPELDSETEHWFESAGNYPPSPFSIHCSWRFDEKQLKIHKSFSEKYNGFLYYNQSVKDVAKKKNMVKTKPFLRKNSTLTRPTASLLARQNKPLDIYSVQLLTRCQRSLGKFDDKASSILSSMPQTQDTKRQKLETGFLRKVSRIDYSSFVHKVPRKGSKVTVPKEPNLMTAQRATRHRFKANSAPENFAKFDSTINKNVQESSSTSLLQKNTPRLQNLKGLHLRKSLRPRELPSNDKKSHTDDPTHSLMSSSIKGRKVKKSYTSKTDCQVYESNISPLDSKASRKCGETIKIKHENSFPRFIEGS